MAARRPTDKGRAPPAAHTPGPGLIPGLGAVLSDRARREGWSQTLIDHVAAQLALHPTWLLSQIGTVGTNPPAAVLAALRARGIPTAAGTQFVKWTVHTRGGGGMSPEYTLVGMDAQTQVAGAPPSTGAGNTAADSGTAASATGGSTPAAGLAGSGVAIVALVGLALLALA